MKSFKNEDGRTIVYDQGTYFSIYQGQNWYKVDELDIQFSEMPLIEVSPGSDTFFIMQLYYAKKVIITSELVENLVKLYKGEMPFVHIEPGKLVIHFLLAPKPQLVILNKEAFFMSDYTNKKWRTLVHEFEHNLEQKNVSSEPVLLAFVRMLLEDGKGNTIQTPRLEEIVSKEEIGKFLEKYYEFTGQSESK